MPIERVVTILTPVFGALAAWLTAWVGKHFPGIPHLNSGDVTALLIAGFTGATAMSLKWLHGRQKFTQVTADVEHLADEVAQRIMSNQQAGPALRDIGDLFKSHTNQIVDALSKDIHLSPSAEQIAQEVVKRLIGGGAGSSSPEVPKRVVVDNPQA